MSVDLALGGTEPDYKKRGHGIGRIAGIAVKSVVTVLCFWYLSRKVDLAAILDAPRTLHVGWAIAAVLALMLQLPFVCLRWCSIVDALEGEQRRVARPRMLAVSAIVTFFSQVMPGVASEGMRAWLLVRLGAGWRKAIASVVIDRAIGIGAFAVSAVVVLALPSALAASFKQRALFQEIFAAASLIGIVALVLAPFIGQLLSRCAYTAWMAPLLRAIRDLMLGSWAGLSVSAMAIAVELLAIASIWCIGRSLNLALSIADAGVLFTVIIGSTLIPISIAGWGIRELAVTAVLGNLGVPLEQALVFSIFFGLALLLASLPGAVVWPLYTPRRARSTTDTAGDR